MKVALTIDDAPTICREADGIALDPSRMDRIRGHLKYAGIKHCVAFVTGAQVKGNERYLEGWLSDGFELGNHTFSHWPASTIPQHEYIEDIKRCDDILVRVGAFEGHQYKWFRFPFLDRGSSLELRKKLAEDIDYMGYRVAHATTDFYDHKYESLLGKSIRQDEPFRATLINNRYRNVAVKSLLTSEKVLEKKLHEEIILIPYCHFGLISSSQLPNILESLDSLNVKWCSMEEAAAQPFYQVFNQNFSLSGLISNSFGFTVKRRLLKKLKRVSVMRRLFGQEQLGAKWPYV